MPESPCQRYGLLRLPKVTERSDGPRPGDNDDDDDDDSNKEGIKLKCRSAGSYRQA